MKKWRDYGIKGEVYGSEIQLGAFVVEIYKIATPIRAGEVWACNFSDEIVGKLPGPDITKAKEQAVDCLKTKLQEALTDLKEL